MIEESAAPDLESLARRERASIPSSAEELAEIHERALLAARAAAAVKGEDVRILDMHDLVSYTDYLVLCTGRNTRLTKRISEEVGFRLKEEKGLLPAGLEGGSSGEWVLMDYLDFVVHIFTPEARDFYRLDVLWKQAPMEAVI
ncbi:MAG TPA: ribosome silencing factor [Thermoleophilia bacterium]|nr:ribosome silencing factor [Thermoleophilia bacterium]